MKTWTFWWIDDETKRITPLVTDCIQHPRDASLRKAKFKAVLVKKDVVKGDWSKVESDLIAATPSTAPDLLIIDQRLGSLNHAQKMGSTLAVSLRTQRPRIPIVLVSAAPTLNAVVLSEQRKECIELFSLNDLRSGERVPDLYAIASGFSSLLEADIKLPAQAARSAIIALLGVPQSDQETFLHGLPHNISSVWDVETPHAFARWVWDTLLNRPGLLGDDLTIATMLGVKTEALKYFDKRLVGCQYSGCFVSPIRRRWWVSLVQQRIRELTDGKISNPLWELGRSLLPASKASLYSTSWGHKDAKVPDCVAFTDELLQKRVAARQEDTTIIPYDLPPPGFEPLRIYRKATS